MELTINQRAIGTKGERNKLRREGKVPAIIYGTEQKGEPISLDGEEIKALLRNMKPGLLSTTVFSLNNGQKKQNVIVKDIQYHVTTYDVLHIDFLAFSDKEVTVEVPIQLVGVAECAGLKLGGVLRHVIRTLKVSCKPKNIPTELVVDVRDMNIGDSKRLSDIVLPAHVTPKAKMSEVAIAIAKKAGT